MTELDAVVVGAGIAGLHQLHLLRERGLRVLGLEEAADVGGAWLSHDHPGARLDVDAHLYQYFFSEALYRDWSWSERFPGGYEVLRWLRFVAERLDLRRDIRFATRVVDTTPGPGGGWRVRTDAGGAAGTVEARCVVRCTGSAATRVDPPGLDTFAGPVLRTACWPRRAPDLTGTRVGVVGSGVSAVQLVPRIVGPTAHLTVFAGTPVDVLPRENPVYGWRERDRDKARFAELRELLPGTVDGTDDAAVPDLAALPAAERRARLEELYADRSLRLWRTVVAQAPDDAVLAEVTGFVRAKMRERLGDPRLADVLVPTDHPFGARPVGLDLGWLEVFARDDVALVDTRATPIRRLRPEGVELVDGTVHAVDTLVLAEDTAPAPHEQREDRPGLFTVTPPAPPANGAVDLQRQNDAVARAVGDLVGG